MRIVDRESLPESKLLPLGDGGDQPIELEAVRDRNGQPKVSRVIDGALPYGDLKKVTGVRFAILAPVKGPTQKRDLA